MTYQEITELKKTDKVYIENYLSDYTIFSIVKISKTINGVEIELKDLSNGPKQYLNKFSCWKFSKLEKRK